MGQGVGGANENKRKLGVETRIIESSGWGKEKN